MPANVVRLYDDASAYGIRAGITIPILGPNGRWSAFTMATDEEDTRTLGAQADEIPGLMIMTAVQFHTRLTALATRFMAPTRPNILTEPQTAVLQKCAEGSTMRNIAEDLGISHRGVIKHVVLARKRLQAKNVTHAVKIAIDLGLIH